MAHWLDKGFLKYREDVLCVYGNSPHYVYIWEEDETGEVFYVGSGTGYRLNFKANRSPEFLEHLSRTKCSPKIIACGMTRDEAFKMEGEFIKEYRRLGSPLVNQVHARDRISNIRPLHRGEKWTINGETKGISEWCKQYGVPYTTTITRVKKYGLSPHQALTFPPVPGNQRHWTRTGAIGYFKSLGLLPEDWQPEVTLSH